MNKHSISALPGVLHWGAFGISGGYLILGSLWILFSDRVAARLAQNEEMLTSISLYKGWGYVLVTALLLSWLIGRYTTALRASEVQLHHIIDAMPVFISYVGTDRRYRFANRAYREQYEEQPEEKHIEEVIGKPAYQAISKYVDKALAGEMVSYETEIPFEERERFMSVQYIPDRGVDGKISGFFVLAQDKTVQIQIEEEQRLWADAFEGCAHGIAIDDPSTNRIDVCNPAFARMHRSSVEDIVGSATLSLYAPADHENVRRHIQKADQIGYARFEASMIRRGVDQSAFPVQVDVVSVLGNDGELLHRVITAQDITDRKQAEKELKESEERYRMVSELTSDYAYKDRVEEGNVIPEWVTESFTRITGYTLEETNAPEFWQQLLHPEDAHLLFSHTQNLLSGQPDTVEIRIFTKSGQVRWVRDYSNPIWDVDQKHVVGLYGAVQDITEYKEAQEKLLLQARWLGQINDAVIALDKNLTITEWNPAAERIYGWKAEEVIGKRGDDLLKTEFFSTSRAKAVEQLHKTGEFSAEIAQLRKDGSRVDIETRTVALRTERGQVTGYVSANRDISERKQIEQALQAGHEELERKVQERTAALTEANALLQALMDNIPDHIYFKDRQSRFIRNSRSQAYLLGLRDPSEAVGKTDFDFFPHAARSYNEEQEIIRSGNPLVDFEEWVVWPDGREMWVSTTKMPLRDAQGQIIGIFGISRDITERKRTEQSIRELNADLEKQAEQLQAANKELEAFSYSVSHDLRAPLRAIDGYTRILVEDYEATLDSEGKRICGVISREARRMGQLIDDLLAFSRLGRREMYSSRIDMKAMAASVFEELLKDEDPARFDFTLGDLPSISADSSLIRQVWVNLLSNAIKFTSKKERAIIEVGSQQTKDEIIYYVRDNGAGFDMEYGNKLFGVFQRLHSESEFSGTGVGLAIVQRIIRRHDGRVWGEAEVDKGATFYFALPHKENNDE